MHAGTWLDSRGLGQPSGRESDQMAVELAGNNSTEDSQVGLCCSRKPNTGDFNEHITDLSPLSLLTRLCVALFCESKYGTAPIYTH